MHNKVRGRTPTGFTEVYAQSLSVDCDLNLWPIDMVFVRDTSSYHDDHLCQIISNPIMHDKVMDRTWTGFIEVYEQNISVDCDLDLWRSDMVLVRDTLSCHDDHLSQIIFKSHYAWQSYGSDTNRFHWSINKVKVQTVTLTFDLATWFLFETHRLVRMIICVKNYFQIHNAQLSYRPDTIHEHTHTHTHREGKLYIPFRHFIAGA